MKHVCLIVAMTLALCSCGTKKIDESLSRTVAQPRAHRWYAFSQDGFEAVTLPQNAPKSADRPWTEAVRIASAGSNFSADATLPDAFAVVNRLGMLSFTDGVPSLAVDSGLFAGETAGNLFFEGDIPFFTLNKDRTFNKRSVGTELRPFIVRFQGNPGLCIPLLNCQDFDLDEKSEITDLTIKDGTFICSVKTYEADRTEFSYFSWKPAVSLDSISGSTAARSMQKEELSTDDYRAALAHEPFSSAPERLRALLDDFPKNMSFSVKCRTLAQNSETLYFRGDGRAALRNACAVVTPNYVLAVFADGTTYVSGALNGRSVINRGNPVAFRLPKLPAGFAYGDAFISQGTLVAAWEEADFYLTGRSGFITVDLDKVLYW